MQAVELSRVQDPFLAEYLFRFKQAALSWPLPVDIDDNQLEQRLYPQLPAAPADQRAVADWSYIQQQLRHKSVTLMRLWQEYKEQFPQGYQYSQFCHLYRQWAHQIDPVMRQKHRAGEKRSQRVNAPRGSGHSNLLENL